MKFLRARVGVLATVTGLVLMTAGVATAQAQGNSDEAQGHASHGDKKVCVSWDRGVEWQTLSPEGKGWHKGHARVVPEVPGVEQQDFVAEVVGVPAIPKIEHTVYQYERTVDGIVETSAWLLEKPDQGDGPAWEQTGNHQVIDQSAVPEVLAVAEVPYIAAVEEIPAYTEYHWTRAAKECKGDKPKHHKGDKKCKHESHDSDESHHSHATTPPVTKAPTAAKPIVLSPAKAVLPIVVSPAEAAVNPLPVAAAAGQADTSGQLAAFGFARFAAFLALGAGFVLRRRRSDV